MTSEKIQEYWVLTVCEGDFNSNGAEINWRWPTKEVQVYKMRLSKTSEGRKLDGF